ncbi:ketopantoate reductase-like protein [Trametes meyenii]|nr:ketopantoate reductase-like protein [Trametes meyenii]
MRIHVVGIGAVGNFVAFHLRRSLSPKHSVIALHRSETAKALLGDSDTAPLHVERDGALLTQEGVEHLPYGEPRRRSRKSDFPPTAMYVRDDPAARRSIGPINSLIVTTKAYAVSSVIRRLRMHLSPDSTVVLLHNGMGVYENIVASIYPNPHERPNFVFCSNTHGLFTKGPLHAVHAAIGDIRLGIAPDPFGHDYEASHNAAGRPRDHQLSLDDIANVSTENPIPPRYLNLRNTIAALTTASGLRASWEPFSDVQIAMRSKLVVNSFINPVSALLQCKNGGVLESIRGRDLADRVCREAHRIFQAEWSLEVRQQRRSLAEQGLGNVLPAPYPRQLKSLVLLREIERVVELTKDNYSSMYMDLKLRRPTEIDFLNGYLMHVGRKHRFRPFATASLGNLVRMRSIIPLAPQP